MDAVTTAVPADPSKPETNARRQKCTAGYSDRWGSPDGTRKASSPRFPSSAWISRSAAARCAAVAPAMVVVVVDEEEAAVEVEVEVDTEAASGLGPPHPRRRGPLLLGWVGIVFGLDQLSNSGCQEDGRPRRSLLFTHRRAAAAAAAGVAVAPQTLALALLLVLGDAPADADVPTRAASRRRGRAGCWCR